jgi:2-methylcitrate dehydratase PrpD
VRDPRTDVVHNFADLAVDTRYSDLSADAAEAAKKSILDTLGVSLAATGLEPVVAPVLDLVRENAGRPEASVLASDTRVPASLAAFANGALAHSLDYDDLTLWGHHAASSIVPVVFAVAERRGGVSGQELVVAVAVGQDIFARLRRHVEWRKDWNISPVMGVFAASAAASRVLGLTREQTAHAMGIASMRSSGTMEVVRGVSDLRGIYAGFSAEGAVTATLLAEKGVTGLGALFEGEFGIFRTYFDGKYDRAKILENLGLDYTGSATLYKRWPSVSTSHSHIHATIQLLTQYDISVEDVEQIRVHVGDWHNVMCQPLDARRAPETVLDARFSLPFLVAIAAVRREIRVADLTEKALTDDEVLAVAQRVIPVPDDSLDWKLEIPPGRVEIVTRDGQRLEMTGSEVPGTAQNPMTWEDLGRKFDDCASAAAVHLSSDQVDRAKQLARQLEAQDDATDLLRDLR